MLSIYEFDLFVFYFIFVFVCLLRLHNLMLDVSHESIYKSQLLSGKRRSDESQGIMANSVSGQNADKRWLR